MALKPAKHLTKEQVRARLAKTSIVDIPGYGSVTRHKLSVAEVQELDAKTSGDAAAAGVWTVIKSFPDLFDDDQETFDLLSGDAMTLGVFSRALSDAAGLGGVTFRDASADSKPVRTGV